jgi:aryl-phospho-beta-D-glucosidase BglC (GH1 family)
VLKRSQAISLAFVFALTLDLATGASAAGFLHTQGQDIVDESGNRIMLRGVGLGNWLLPEGYMWKFGAEGDRPRKIEKLVSDLTGDESATRFWSDFRRNYITEADIRRISELGFNSVRVPLNARLFLTEGENAGYKNEGFKLLENLVTWCRTYGVYVIIDMHAAPGGQTGSNIDDSSDDQPRLFMEERNQKRLVQLWVKIANRYKDEPTVAAYDLLNEPLPERTGAFAKYQARLEPLYRHITEAIRALDKKHMITVEGGDWANNWSVFSKPFDDNLVYQFHYYCWDRPTKLNSISKYLDQRNRLGRPVWVGETGEKDDTIYWATTDYFEANHIGWAFWPWKKMDAANAPYSIKPPKNWRAIAAYSRGNGADRPTKEAAQEIFDELLRNIRLENCVFFPDVVNALFHRVPGRVQAENYGFEGLNKSYFVNNGSQKSKSYRTSEPVPVELVGTAEGQWRSEQAIRLGAGEWTAYSIEAQTVRSCDIAVRVKVEAGPAAFDLALNDATQKVDVRETGWTELKLKSVELTKGSNRLKLSVESGVIAFDWVDLQ